MDIHSLRLLNGLSGFEGGCKHPWGGCEELLRGFCKGALVTLASYVKTGEAAFAYMSPGMGTGASCTGGAVGLDFAALLAEFARGRCELVVLATVTAVYVARGRLDVGVHKV